MQKELTFQICLIQFEKIVQRSETTPVSLKTNEPSEPITLVIAKPTKRATNTKPTRKGVEFKTATINHNIPKVSPNKSLYQLIKCSLSYPYKRNIVACGTVHLSSERQFIHEVPLQDDCYKVSLDEVVIKHAFLPHKNGEFTLFEDAYKSFVAWPKYLVQTESKVPEIISHQNSTKRKPTYISSDALLKKTMSNTNKMNA
ncbi:unnamed protein product [Lactuca saligna]|uniref:DUF8039 domain-containing protein n=1 Tax=Lactuca saligna TaxID=75948 RepID=A0AA35YIP4_LACSI|nr:unnamed protein product [Lactuca saligna]